MKKAILLGSVLALLTGFSANAQSTPFNLGMSSVSVLEGYPRSSRWNRHDNNYRYWNQVHMEQEQRNQRALDDHASGYRSGYDKNHSKHHGKNAGKSRQGQDHDHHN